MKRLVGALALAMSAVTVSAAKVEWTMSPNTCSDTDVNVEGRCLYAYTPSTAELNVNGVQFFRWTQKNPVDFANDASLSSESTRHVSAGWLGETVEWTGGDAYKALLNCNWYGGELNRTFTLKGLTAGKRYLVQLWICDARVTVNSQKKLTIGDVVGNCYGNGYGSNFTGRFTADGETQGISLKWTHEANLTAFQVRCLDEARITWTGGYTSGESDIRSEGRLAYAYKGGSTEIVGGTVFQGVASNPAYFGSEDSPDVVFSPALGNLHNSTFCETSETVPQGAYSYSPAYVDLMRGFYATYADDYNRRNVTLRNLKPGRRYLVQLWVCDNRSDTYSSRTVVVGCGIALAHCNGIQYGHASMAVGTFTAVSTEQTFSCFHRVAGESMSDIQEMIGPMQVRCLDDGYEGWVVGDTGLDGSVDTRGKPLYAYAGHDTEVSGTSFKGFVGNSGDYGEVAFKTNGVLCRQDVTGKSPGSYPFVKDLKVEVSTAVSNLLGGGAWNSFNVNQTVELRDLVPGRRYLVQAWFLDARKNRHAKFAGLPVEFRLITGDTNQNDRVYSYDKAPLGQYATGIIRPSDETYSIPFEMYWGQLNAIQVRALDVVAESRIVWECAETKAGYDSVSKEGTTHCAYAPKEFNADGVQFGAAPKLREDLGGDGKIVFRRRFKQEHYEYAAEDYEPLFRNGWFNYDDNEESGENTVTLGKLKPGYEYLVQLFVADLRDNAGLNAREITIDGKTGNYGPTNGKFAFGTCFTGRFTANSVTKSFDMLTGKLTVQLNAIQVRELAPVSTMAFKAAETTVWSSDGAGWEIDGVDQAGTAIWAENTGNYVPAYVGGDATLSLGSDVTAGAVAGTGNLVIGAAGTEYKFTARGEIIAPHATVNAVFGNFDLRKTCPGVTVFAGACPNLESVLVGDGKVVLDGSIPKALDITLGTQGTLGFSAVKALGISSFSGGGTLAGPGGIALSDGEEFALPAGIRFADGFKWNLSKGSSLVLPAGSDASSFAVEIVDPRSYVGEAIVSAPAGTDGTPEFVLGERGYRVVWSEELSAWTLEETGLVIILR